MSNQLLEKMAYDLAAKEHALTDASSKRVQASLGSFTKFDGNSSPEAYLCTFDSEVALCQIHREEDLMKIFPSLMGSNFANATTKLRACTSWSAMRDAFCKHFAVDKNVLLAEMKSLRVTNYDVDAYVTAFNKVANLYPIKNQGDEHYLKQLFVDPLPGKVKEKLVTDREYDAMSLLGAQIEARRL